MPGRRSKNAAEAKPPTEFVAALRKVLVKQKKEELVDLVVELARADPRILRQLMLQFEASVAPHELVAATRQAVADATAFDARDINHNFNYDHAAYREAQQNLNRLLELGQFDTAMELALELMKLGSYQVEMSDEGLMTSEIGDCLRPVIQAVNKSGLPRNEALDWCLAMLKNDRVGCIATGELRALQSRLEAFMP